MTVDFITWNVNPEIVSFGKMAIRWYGVLFASAFFFGYIILSRVFKKEGETTELLDKLTIYMALGTVIGARLGHCFFYEPDYFLKHPLEILKVWHGGLASHGAAIGILLALWLFKNKTGKTYFWTLDRIVIVTALSGLFIRMGNLMNSEIYGIQTHLPWGFIFVRNGETLPKHPTQIYEALSYFLIFLLLYFLFEKKNFKAKEGLTFSLFLIILFTVRFFIEFIKENQVPFENTLPLNMGQLLSLPFILTGLIFLYLVLKKQPLRI
jgi:phosphatidylglycerol:prolipoprotein diacylglycerol transferase